MSIIDPEVYRAQQDIQDRCRDRYPDIGTADDHSIRCLQLADEVFEVLHLMAWKPHRHGDQHTVDRDELLDELSDVFKFFMNLLIIHGVTLDEFQRAYARKHLIVLKRLSEEGL